MSPRRLRLHFQKRGESVGRAKRSAVVVVAAMLVLASCGSSNDKSSPATSSTTGKQPTYAASLQTKIPQVMKDNVIPGAIILIRSMR